MCWESSTTAHICVCSGARTKVQDWGVAHRTTFAKTAEMLFVTTYMPDSSHTLEAYEATVKQVKSIVRCHREKGRFRRRVVVGGDFNISLLRDIEGVTGAAVELRRPHRGNAADEWATKHEHRNRGHHSEADQRASHLVGARRCSIPNRLYPRRQRCLQVMGDRAACFPIGPCSHVGDDRCRSSEATSSCAQTALCEYLKGVDTNR